MAAQGTYLENIHFDGKNIVLTSIDPLDPSVVADTILDGNKAGSTVAFDESETEACVLCGFTVRNGSAENGGGICGGSWDRHTRATIRNNTITGNSAKRGGGLAYCDGLVKDNAISGNSADYGGGLYECGGTIESNNIAENTANSNSQPFGGGLYGCSALIQNNSIAGNAGAGLADCAGTIQNNKISWNAGGGVYGCGGLIQNDLITENLWDWGGGGLCECSGTIQNNTIAGNLGDGVAFCKGTIRNCIIWGNSREELIESKRITFSCIEGLTEPGADNINRDPLFVDPANGDYRLRAGSPCVDSGLGYYWFSWPQRDLNGNCRLAGKRVDIGCYEFGALRDSDGDLLSDTDESKQGTDFLKEDTDDDGLRDGLELLRGSDPLAPTPPRIVHVPTGALKTQQWLCLAVDGDEIVVLQGIYRQNLQFCGPDVILRSLHPDDPGTVAATILDGGEVGSVVSFLGTESEGCVLAGFTIQNGRAISGAGILGGMLTSHTHAAIRNNVIRDNRANTNGGGLAYCDGVIENNTIYANSSKGWGGGLAHCDGTIRNCIIWANTADNGEQLDWCVIPSYCCISAWTQAGQGNISRKAVLLTDPDGPDNDPETYKDNDYRLGPNSPCIDAGMNEDWMKEAVDLDGNPRIWRGKASLTVDMGAYEYGASDFKVAGVAKQAAGQAQITWNSRPDDNYVVWSCRDLLAGPWTEEATIASQEESTAWTDPETACMCKFYKIELK